MSIVPHWKIDAGDSAVAQSDLEVDCLIEKKFSVTSSYDFHNFLQKILGQAGKMPHLEKKAALMCKKRGLTKAPFLHNRGKLRKAVFSCTNLVPSRYKNLFLESKSLIIPVFFSPNDVFSSIIQLKKCAQFLVTMFLWPLEPAG